MKKIWEYNMSKGLILGGAQISISLWCYLFSKSSLGLHEYIFNTIVWLVGLIYFTRSYCKSQKFVDFRSAFTVAFGILLCSGILQYFYQFIIITFIEENYIILVKNNWIDFLENIKKNPNIPKEQLNLLNEKITQIKELEVSDRTFSVISFLAGMFWNSIGYAIIGVIMGGIFQKKTHKI